MKVGTILSACNDVKAYFRFIPLFIKYWKRYAPDATIVIVFVASSIPDCLQEWAQYLKRVDVPQGLNSAYVAQIIRLFWPAVIESTDAVLISDIDMLPMTNIQYLRIETINDPHEFVSACPKSNRNRPTMCYQIATPQAWALVFGIFSEADVWTRVQEASGVYDGKHGGVGWGLDEQCLLRFLSLYDKKRFISLESLQWKRLDRPRITDFTRTPKGYTDSHLYASRSRLTDEHLKELIQRSW